MYTNEDKQYILKEFLNNISNISNKEYQKRVWILGEGPEHEDFIETNCHFFDVGELIFDHYRDFNITDEQYSRLIEFRDELEKFKYKFDAPHSFIDTPEWGLIMEEAKEVLKAFNYH